MSLSKKYNLILMSDDNSTRRLRMSKRTLQIILICLILIPILLVISSMLAVQSIQKEQNMRMSFNSQQRELIELRSKVERLNNLNTLLEKYDSTYLAQTELNNKNSKTESPKPKEEPVLSFSPSNGHEAQAIIKVETPNNKEDKKNVLENELIDQNNQESVPLTEFEENGNSSTNMDMNLAKIEKLKVKQQNNSNLQVSFDLINTGQKSQLEGNVQFFLLDKAGSKLALTASAKSLSYRINKLKKVVVDAKYDAGNINPQEHILIIEINNTPEGIIYREQVALITE